MFFSFSCSPQLILLFLDAIDLVFESHVCSFYVRPYRKLVKDLEI